MLVSISSKTLYTYTNPIFNFVKPCTYVVSTIRECNVSMESNLILELGPRVQVNFFNVTK